MVKKSDKTAAKNAAQKMPAEQAGAATREAMADASTGAEKGTGWGLKNELGDQSASAANQAKEGDRAKVNGVDVVYYQGKWVPAPKDKAAPSSEAEPAKEPAQVGWGLDGQQKIVDEHGNDASDAGKVKKARLTAAEKREKAKADAADKAGVNLTGMSKDLVQAVEGIERLAEERAAIGEDIKEIYAELKSKGYSSTTLRKVIARRQLDPEKRKEQDDMLSLYEEALG